MDEYGRQTAGSPLQCHLHRATEEVRLTSLQMFAVRRNGLQREIGDGKASKAAIIAL